MRATKKKPLPKEPPHSPPATPSATSTSSTDASSPPEAQPPPPAPSSEGADKRAPFSRRGHVKSRLGCFSCKRRRVKCNELRPSCSSCRRLGLRCEYPAQAPGTSAASGPIVAPVPQASLGALNMEDLRFYHQFMTVGHPSLPLTAGQEVWSQVAAMSHQYDFLAHSLLGLGAAHVTQNNPGIDYTASALQHRLTAISRVNEEFARTERTPEEADALMAAVMCLVTQSSLLQSPESMIEYLTMCRGGQLILSQLIPDIDVSLFSGMSMERHVGAIMKVATRQPEADMDVVDNFETSVQKIRTLCSTETQLRYADALLQCAAVLRNGGEAHDAWTQFIHLWLMPTTFSTQEYTDFVAPGNHASRLLIIHCFHTDYIMGQFCIDLKMAPRCSGRKNMVVSWTRNVAEALPENLKEYAEWALEYAEMLEKSDTRYLLSP